MCSTDGKSSKTCTSGYLMSKTDGFLLLTDVLANTDRHMIREISVLQHFGELRWGETNEHSSSVLNGKIYFSPTV